MQTRSLNRMVKKTFLLCVFLSSGSMIFGQIKYDTGPTYPLSSSTPVSLSGRVWTNRVTYAFKNGTSDIAGNAERNAIRQAFKLWSCVAPIVFVEKSTTSNLSTDIVISWNTGNHGDGHPFSKKGGVLAHASPPDTLALNLC